MTKQIQLRRGTTSEHLLFTGANGEITYDTTLKVVTVHDAETLGGNYLVGSATTQAISNKIWLGIGTDSVSGEVRLLSIGDANIEGNLLLRSLDITYRDPFSRPGTTENPSTTTVTGINTSDIRVGYGVSGIAVSAGTTVISVGLSSVTLSNVTTQDGVTESFIFSDPKSGSASVHILDVDFGDVDDLTVGTALSVTGNSYVVGYSTFVNISRFEDKVIFDSTNSIQLPVGGTGDRDPSPVTGQIRFNTDDNTFEGYDGAAWGSLGGVKDIDGDTYIAPETSPGSDEDTLYLYTGGSLSGTISSTTGAVFNVNVGVGSTQPSSTLDINGTVKVSGISTFEDRVIFDSTNSIQIPVGTTGERDSVGTAVTGQIRYNIDNSSFEGYGPGGEWGSLGGVKDVDGDTYIIPETAAGTDEDRLYFYNGGTNTVSIGQTDFDIDVNLFTNDQYVQGTNFAQQLNVSGVSTFQGNVYLGDDDKIVLGDGGDLEIYSDGSTSYIQETGPGSLWIKSNSTEIRSGGNQPIAKFIDNAGVELYYAFGDKKFETTGIGATVFGTLETQQLNVSGVSTFQDNVNLGDNDRLRFGDGNDLQIYHDGGNSFIDDTGIGDLVISATHLRLRSAAAETYLLATANSSVELYYNNSKKFETTGFGATVFGTLDTERLNVASVADKTTIFDGNNITLSYNTGGGNVAICTNPSGPITLNVIDIPTTSDFDNRAISFAVIVQQGTTAYGCTAATLNGVSFDSTYTVGTGTHISYPGGTVSVGNTSGYDVFNFTGINTVGSASTTENYKLLSNLNGDYRLWS